MRGRIWPEILRTAGQESPVQERGRDSQEPRSRSRKPGTEPGMADPGQGATDLARGRQAGGTRGPWSRAGWGLGDSVEISGARGGGRRDGGGGGERESEAEGEGREGTRA